MNRIFVGDCRDVMRQLIADGVKVQTCVTSPPYWGLRDYGVAGQLGLEETPAEYVGKMVEVFRMVRDLLADDGTLWLNLGDSYAGSWGAQSREHAGKHAPNVSALSANQVVAAQRKKSGTGSIPAGSGLKPKDLVGIPWRVAFALQEDGWWLRQDIIWCLSGGTVVYARTQKGDMPITLKDLARLNPATVKLWNGERWTQLLGMSKSKRMATELSLVLRSGERIACTPTHKFPTSRGLLEASQIKVGDRLIRVRLPEPETPKSPTHISDDAAWFAGLYLAEGSMSGDTIQIAGHAKEVGRWERVQRVAAAYGGSTTRTVHGNSMDIRVYGRLLVGLVRELVSGDNARNKHIGNVVWRYSDRFLAEYMHGYLDGDGHWEPKNERWRLGFCRNYALEQDLRTACARLGWTLTLNHGVARFQGGEMPAFRGELRMTRSGHRNERSRDEVVKIERGRCRWVYDLGVADEPHLFALASGILTHNSKPNPMPESVTDRCTKAHEYLFLLSKRERYYFDADAIKEPASENTHPRRAGNGYKTPDGWDTTKGKGGHGSFHREGREEGRTGYQHKKRKLAEAGIGTKNNDSFDAAMAVMPENRNKRSVWTVATQPYKEAHFATFPPSMIEPCILAGSRSGDIVFDPFFGSGTTGEVAERLGRRWIGIELNGEYVKMAKRRTSQIGIVL